MVKKKQLNLSRGEIGAVCLRRKIQKMAMMMMMMEDGETLCFTTVREVQVQKFSIIFWREEGRGRQFSQEVDDFVTLNNESETVSH